MVRTYNCRAFTAVQNLEGTNETFSKLNERSQDIGHICSTVLHMVDEKAYLFHYSLVSRHSGKFVPLLPLQDFTHMCGT